MSHPQILQSPIVNDCLKVKIHGYTRPQFFPKLFLQMSVRELRNSLVSEPYNGGLKYARGADNNTIISD